MVKQLNEGKDFKKFAYFLPNIFTALNMGCGFMSIIFVQKGLFHQACMLLILGSIFDSVSAYGRSVWQSLANACCGE